MSAEEQRIKERLDWQMSRGVLSDANPAIAKTVAPGSTRYDIFHNDEDTSWICQCWDAENVLRFFKDKWPELYSIQETIDGSETRAVNGVEWLEENPCPCCGQRLQKEDVK